MTCRCCEMSAAAAMTSISWAEPQVGKSPDGVIPQHGAARRNRPEGLDGRPSPSYSNKFWSLSSKNDHFLWFLDKSDHGKWFFLKLKRKSRAQLLELT
jgi:hypothetical protein